MTIGSSPAVEDAAERVVLVVAFEAVVGHAALGPVVRPDLARAVARPDHLLPGRRPLGVDPLALELVEPRAEHAERLLLVLVLALLVLDRDDEPRRLVREADGRVGRVDRLPARPGRRRYTSTRTSWARISTSTSSASGSTATVAADVWIRPLALRLRHPLHAVDA